MTATSQDGDIDSCDEKKKRPALNCRLHGAGFSARYADDYRLANADARWIVVRGKGKKSERFCFLSQSIVWRLAMGHCI